MRFKSEAEEEDSQESKLARQLVIAKQEADGFEAQLDAVPRWHRRERAELRQRIEDARVLERELLESLGAKPRA